MTHPIKEFLITWNSEKNERLKMQRAYFALVILLAVIAGLTTLVNVSIGQNLVIISAIFALVYVVNAVSWMILEMIIAKKVDALSKPTTKKR